MALPGRKHLASIRKNAVRSDSTSGFIESGVVMVRIPDRVSLNHSIMPKNLFWIKISADEQLDAFSSLYAIRPHGLKVVWQNDGSRSFGHIIHRLPPGAIKTAAPSIPGLGKIHQVVETFGGKPPEDKKGLKTRINERLRHKNRAVTPWDYERLVLEEFPGLDKVKCFSAMSAAGGKPPDYGKPGHVLIAVLPHVDKTTTPRHARPVVDSSLLKRVLDFARSFASPFAAIEVTNPLYEIIQVRCAVKFREDVNEGYFLSLLDNDISTFLSPWRKTGPTKCFGWQLLKSEVESFIRSLEYVDFTTDFSMLQIVSHVADDEDGSFYRLNDTARPDHPNAYASLLSGGPLYPPPGPGREEARPASASRGFEETEVKPITPVHPWSIAVPARRHWIETVRKKGYIKARPTGIDELEIGETFIIPGK